MAILATVVAVAGWVWFDGPGEREPGLIRIASYHQYSGGNPETWADTGDLSPWGAVVIFAGMGDGSHLDTEGLGLRFTVEQLDTSADDARVTARQEYSAAGLAQGDTVQAGAVSIEVVKVWNALLGRNRAADVRVTFDESRVADPPPPSGDLTVITDGTSDN